MDRRKFLHLSGMGVGALAIPLQGTPVSAQAVDDLDPLRRLRGQYWRALARVRRVVARVLRVRVEGVANLRRRAGVRRRLDDADDVVEEAVEIEFEVEVVTHLVVIA